MTTSPKPQVFDSLRQAAAALQLPLRLLKAAKTAGCTAFRSNRVYEAELLAYLAANPQLAGDAADDPRNEKIHEEIRKLRIANDAKEGRLIERVWVATRIQQAAGDLNNRRARWEAELPVKFAETAGDIAECRTILKGILDEVMANVQDLGKHIEEETP